jgi:hypothetical protein
VDLKMHVVGCISYSGIRVGGGIVLKLSESFSGGLCAI